MKFKQINGLVALSAALALTCSCSGKHAQEVTVQPGQLWQNGEAIYMIEDSDSVWNLYGGTLHEGGWELKLPKRGSWELRSDCGGHAIVTKQDGKATDVLRLVEGAACTSRDSLYAHVTTSLDSAQAHGMAALIDGTYKASDGKMWRFATGSVTVGKEKRNCSIGKSLEMYDRVLLFGSDSTAMAYSFTSPAQMKLVPAQYVDDPGAYVYFLDSENAQVLKSTRNNRFADLLGRQLMPQFWMRSMVCGFSHAQRVAFLNGLKARSGSNATLKTNIEILETAIDNLEKEESFMSH